MVFDPLMQLDWAARLLGNLLYFSFQRGNNKLENFETLLANHWLNTDVDFVLLGENSRWANFTDMQWSPLKYNELLMAGPRQSARTALLVVRPLYSVG